MHFLDKLDSFLAQAFELFRSKARHLVFKGEGREGKGRERRENLTSIKDHLLTNDLLGRSQASFQIKGLRVRASHYAKNFVLTRILLKISIDV